MCGIFGLITKAPYPSKSNTFINTVNSLFKLSESRGKEAAGFAILNSINIVVHRSPHSASAMIKTKKYKDIIKNSVTESLRQPQNNLVLIGHTRLVTSGLQSIDYNNQPVVVGDIAGIHNGIIVNVDSLWEKHHDLKKQTDLDSEIILALINKYRAQNKPLAQALPEVFTEIYGETSVALLFADLNVLLLATNTGSIYYSNNTKEDMAFVFASESYILQQHYKHFLRATTDNIKHLAANKMLMVDLTTLDTKTFDLATQPSFTNANNLSNLAPKQVKSRYILDKWQKDEKKRLGMVRCKKCLLPITMPFIEFDANGVCNYCLHYNHIYYKGADALEKILAKYRKKGGAPDCIFPLSGGRDSCYGLYLIKEKFGMNPIAYTYDWGMVTDLARRNQSRMCSKLGVEHVWVSADIKKKRQNIGRNVKAWSKHPNLGMIPLFMAGDKQYFYYANQMMKFFNINLTIMCENRLERTDFKTGFCGVPPHHQRISGYQLTKNQNVKLASYYIKQFLLNPHYFNRSLFDSLAAFRSYYFLDHDYLLLFHYYPWDEKEINTTLIEKFDWEIAKDSPSTWRIGDGTAAFYNYIYHTVAGFSEYDTFRSNQIRQGVLSREEALSLVERENRPRFESIKEYTNLIEVNFDKVIQAINNIPKLY